MWCANIALNVAMLHRLIFSNSFNVATLQSGQFQFFFFIKFSKSEKTP